MSSLVPTSGSGRVRQLSLDRYTEYALDCLPLRHMDVVSRYHRPQEEAAHGGSVLRTRWLLCPTSQNGLDRPPESCFPLFRNAYYGPRSIPYRRFDSNRQFPIAHLANSPFSKELTPGLNSRRLRGICTRLLAVSPGSLFGDYDFVLATKIALICRCEESPRPLAEGMTWQSVERGRHSFGLTYEDIFILHCVRCKRPWSIVSDFGFRASNFDPRLRGPF